MNSGYLFDKECDNEDFTIDSAKIFSIENKLAVNATEVTSERLHPRKFTFEKIHSNVVQCQKPPHQFPQSLQITKKTRLQNY